MKFLNKLVLAVFLILIWFFLAKTTNPYILPSPLDILANIGAEINQLSFWQSIGFTCLRALIGIGFSLLLGASFGILLGWSDFFRNLFRPLIIAIQSAPVISWLLLALIWFRQEMIPPFVVFVSTFPIVVLTIENGIRDSKHKWQDLVHVYKIPQQKAIMGIYLPEIKTYLVTSISLLSSISIKAVVMAEVIARVQNGIGSKMELAQRNIDTTSVFSWTLIVIFITIIFESNASRWVKK